MDAILSTASKPRLLRPGIQPAIAAGEDEKQAAAEVELISILEGASFRGSARSVAFLRFVVEETLAGRQELLKERTIGATVLGKAATYDTGSDSGVRVRANEVRKRLAAHYDATAPRAGIRIELPSGTYVPRFAAASAAPVTPAAAKPSERSSRLATPPSPQDRLPPPMQLWQMAAPSLVAIFLALIAIRGNVASSDSFSRFWNRAMAGQSAISIVVDADGLSEIPATLADAAMPFESIASVFQRPVHIVADGREAANTCVIHISTRRRPAEPALLYLNGAALYRGRDGAALWLWAENAEKLRSAAQTLASPSGFPDIP